MLLVDMMRNQPESLRADYAAVDWAATPLGPEEHWSPALQQAAATCLASRFPMLLAWGPDLVMIYNASYLELIGGKHPALGRPAHAVFPEIWDTVGPLFGSVLRTGEAVYDHDLALLMDRAGFLEQVFFTFCYSLVQEPDGSPGGVLNVVVETTSSVLSRRRLEVLRLLGEELTTPRDEAAVVEAALRILRSADRDFDHVVLVRSTSLAVGTEVEGRTVRIGVPLESAGSSGLDLLVTVNGQLRVDDDLLDLLSVSARIVGGALAVVRTLAETVNRSELQAAHADRLAALTVVLQELSRAGSVEAVLNVVARSAVTVMQADGTVVALVGPDGRLHSRFSTGFPDATVDSLSVIPLDTRLPMGDPAVTGRSWFFADREEALTCFPDARAEFETSGAQAAASLPLPSGTQVRGALTLTWNTERSFTAEERDVLEVLASATAQALERIAARDAEREAARRVSEIAETLQRSLLTQVPDVDGLAVAARYRPAKDHARVGGDWYDVFPGPDGVTRIVVGDVTGHDRDAAAAMGQLRNMLRGVAYAHPGSPQQVLGDLEEAMLGLGVGTLATVLHGEVRWEADGSAVLLWCNAGHPPPVLLRADGSVSTLGEGDPDMLLGLVAGWERADHRVALAVGDTVLLHTDGLYERRGEGLDESSARVLGALRGTSRVPLEQWCDTLLDDLGDEVFEDDVVVLAVRVLATADESGLVVPRHPASVAEVRRYTRTACVGLPVQLVDTATLLVSELTTNAVVHGDGEISVRVVPTDTGVRVEVRDESEALPEERPPDLDAEGGRGIDLVARLATAWGVRPESRGKTVWFEVGP